MNKTTINKIISFASYITTISGSVVGIILLIIGYGFHKDTIEIMDFNYILLGGLLILSSSRFADFNINKAIYSVIDVAIFGIGCIFSVKGLVELDNLGLISEQMISMTETLMNFGGNILTFAIVVWIAILLFYAFGQWKEVISTIKDKKREHNNVIEK